MNERIVIAPEIQHGKPVVRGTRLPVARLLGGLAGGMTFDELCLGRLPIAVLRKPNRPGLGHHDHGVTHGPPYHG